MTKNSNYDDLLTDSSTALPSQEARLREQLWLLSEEIRLISHDSRRTICHYDIPTKTLSVPKNYAREHHMREVIPDYPDSVLASIKDDYPETTRLLTKFYAGILRGEPTGFSEIPFAHPGQPVFIWKQMNYHMVFDQDGNPRKAIIFVDDITQQKHQEQENQQLRENEHLLRMINQHSDRTICYYNIAQDRARRWDEETCAQCFLPHLCEQSPDELLSDGSILPESVPEFLNMFREIRGGTLHGAIKLRAKTPTGQKRWFSIRYSTILSDAGSPIAALISHKDITERYEHEMAYLRHIQNLQNEKNHIGMLEVDLDTDLIENQGGQMSPPGLQTAGLSMTDFAQRMVQTKMLKEDQIDGLTFFSSDYLSAQLSAGTHYLERTWQMRFLNGSPRWIQIAVDLVSDPYSGHRKAFFRMTDVTEEQSLRLDLQLRSETDSMTGLYNRATTEDRIRALLSQEDLPGILIILDLDDLKGINDTYGHTEGDRAILGIARMLKTHFRESDVIGRIGGDEFLIYLPGAAENRDTISASLSSLLRKMTTISIGASIDLRIHCSIGCAVQTDPSQTFDELYRLADIALYHVKRNNKNNFAFYSPEMEHENFHFQSQRLFSLQSDKKFELDELHHLLNAISDFYQLVLSMDLSANDYFLMSEVQNGIFSKLPVCGAMDDFVTITAKGLHPDDLSAYLERLSRQALLQAYAQGQKSVHHRFRFYNGSEYQWTEAIIIFYNNENGDVCDFTLVRWADTADHG